MNVRPSIRIIFLLILLAGVALSSDLVLAQAPGKRITSKRTNGMTVVVSNESGKLTGGENAVCAIFQDFETRGPVDVQKVSLKFTLRVGRIPGGTIAAQLNRNGQGRYCGHVNLGRQYYDPANYYVEMHYTNTTEKKRKLSFWVTVK